MSLPGQELFRCYDQHGQIRVLEDGPHRYLAFGDGAEQSCIYSHDPTRLVHQYTQGMMLALLYLPAPNHATVLGLGAGSLVNALLACRPSLRVTAVELRPLVVTVARQWFGFQDSERLQLCIEDAGTYMAADATETDILMADIYDDQGMDDTQLRVDFLSDCYHRLSARGILVLNLWDQHNGAHPLALDRLGMLFGDCLVCPIDEGNLIAFAFKGGTPELNQRRLMPEARRLATRLEIPLQRLVGRLRRP